MDPTVELFLTGARTVVTAVADPAVAAAWDEPSVLEEQLVSGLAGHLARGAVWVVGDYLDAGPPSTPVAVHSAADYSIALISNATEADHDAIRARGADVAAIGHAALVALLRERLAALEERFAGIDPGTPIAVAGGLVLRLDTYLETRVVEQVVHLDDLARSVRVDPWPLPDAARTLVIGIAVDVARRRHGDDAVVRAFYRRGFADDVFPVY